MNEWGRGALCTRARRWMARGAGFASTLQAGKAAVELKSKRQLVTD